MGAVVRASKAEAIRQTPEQKTRGRYHAVQDKLLTEIEKRVKGGKEGAGKLSPYELSTLSNTIAARMEELNVTEARTPDPATFDKTNQVQADFLEALAAAGIAGGAAALKMAKAKRKAPTRKVKDVTPRKRKVAPNKKAPRRKTS